MDQQKVWFCFPKECLASTTVESVVQFPGYVRFLSIRGIGKKSVAEVLLKLKEMEIDVDDLISRLDAK